MAESDPADEAVKRAAAQAASHKSVLTPDKPGIGLPENNKNKEEDGWNLKDLQLLGASVPIGLLTNAIFEEVKDTLHKAAAELVNAVTGSSAEAKTSPASYFLDEPTRRALVGFNNQIRRIPQPTEPPDAPISPKTLQALTQQSALVVFVRKVMRGIVTKVQIDAVPSSDFASFPDYECAQSPVFTVEQTNLRLKLIAKLHPLAIKSNDRESNDRSYAWCVCALMFPSEKIDGQHQVPVFRGVTLSRRSNSSLMRETSSVVMQTYIDAVRNERPWPQSPEVSIPFFNFLEKGTIN